MANVVASLPIRPHYGMGGKTTIPSIQIETESTDVQEGDILITGSTDEYRALVDNSPAINVIWGVASIKAGITSTAGDYMTMYLPLPGIAFEGTMIASAGTDQTVANSTAKKVLGFGSDIGEHSVTGHACILGTDGSAEVAYPYKFAMQRDFTAPSRPGAGLPRDGEIINPRVVFFFKHTIWTSTAATS